MYLILLPLKQPSFQTRTSIHASKLQTNSPVEGCRTADLYTKKRADPQSQKLQQQRSKGRVGAHVPVTIFRGPKMRVF